MRAFLSCFVVLRWELTAYRLVVKLEVVMVMMTMRYHVFNGVGERCFER